MHDDNNKTLFLKIVPTKSKYLRLNTKSEHTRKKPRTKSKICILIVQTFSTQIVITSFIS